MIGWKQSLQIQNRSRKDFAPTVYQQIQTCVFDASPAEVTAIHPTTMDNKDFNKELRIELNKFLDSFLGGIYDKEELFETVRKGARKILIQRGVKDALTIPISVEMDGDIICLRIGEFIFN